MNGRRGADCRGRRNGRSWKFRRRSLTRLPCRYWLPEPAYTESVLRRGETGMKACSSSIGYFIGRLIAHVGQQGRVHGIGL